MKILITSAALEFPLASYCLASALSQHPETSGNQIELLHLNLSRLNTYNQKNSEIWRYIAHVEQSRPQIITFSVYLWNVLITRELLTLTKKLYPDIHIIIGGPELVTTQAADTFLDKEEIRAAVRGEGEVTLTEIIQRLACSDNLHGIAGCSYRENGMNIHEPDRIHTGKEQLEYPSPYLTGWIKPELFDRVENGVFKKGVYPRALAETYRGCYMKCSYCQWGNGSAVRSQFSLSRVYAELTWIISAHIARLFIIDAMFGYNLQTAKDILNHIIHEKERCQSQIEIICYHNHDFFDDELLELYRIAGVTVELDLQSINENVLERIGRRKWSGENFSNHLERFRAHRVKMTGSSDLIIGLPGDCLASFEESVNYLFEQGLTIGLFHTSIIAGTRMASSVEEDGIVYSDTAPGMVFRNATFPVHEMIEARLIGHGVDFFIRYPQTARALCMLNNERPVKLCKDIGRKIWEKYDLMYGESWQYSRVLTGMQDEIESIVEELSPQPEVAEILRELFRMEAAISAITMPEKENTTTASRPVRPVVWDTGDWTQEALYFMRDLATVVPLRHRVDLLLLMLQSGKTPAPDVWRMNEEPVIALVYESYDRKVQYLLIDTGITMELLERCNGYFTVAACLDTIAGSLWRQRDMSVLWETLKTLAEAGLIVPGAWIRNQRFLQQTRRRGKIPPV